MKNSKITDVKILELKSFSDNRGRLSIFEIADRLSFPIRRFFVLDEMKTGIPRGNHAHKKCHQLLMVLNGRPNIQVRDGKSKKLEKIKGCSQLLHVPPGIWVNITPKTNEDKVLVLCSHPFVEKDYIYEWAEFLESKNLDSEKSLKRNN